MNKDGKRNNKFFNKEICKGLLEVIYYRYYFVLTSHVAFALETVVFTF